MEEVNQLSASTDSLLTCCLCRNVLKDAVQLTCLHNCCRQCFNAAVTSGNSRDVACTVCGTVTYEGTEKANGFIEKEVQRYAAIVDSRSCGVCKDNGDPNKAAAVWCPDCHHSLCEYCAAGHRQYLRHHSTLPLDELASLEEVYPRQSASTCPVHKKPQEIACVNCQAAKCISCWAECNENKHEMHIAGQESFNMYVGELTAYILSMESELLRKSAVLEKPMSIIKNMVQESRALHLEQISQRKRRIVDAVETAYQEIECLTTSVYEDLEKEADIVSAVAAAIASNLSDAQSYIYRLVKSKDQCEILNQQKIVLERLQVLSAELDVLSDKLDTVEGAVKFDFFLPEDLDSLVNEWIGMPALYLDDRPSPSHGVHRLQQPKHHYTFGAASASTKLSFNCFDVALTIDGRLLLAANEHGMIEFCSLKERELCRWLPKHSNERQAEYVQAVAALGDGRAAVSLFWTKLVVLLRRREKSSSHKATAADDVAWIEDCLLSQLPWHPRWLSTFGDVIAVTDSGRQLQLMSIGRGQWLDSELQREYNIDSLAVAERAIVTGSWGKVMLGEGRRAPVIDAHSLEDDEKRLWRHQLNNGIEELGGICLDARGGCLYVAVRMSDWVNCRVSALSMSDGSEVRRVALSVDGPQPLLPGRLSLCTYRTDRQLQSAAGNRSSCSSILAALCLDATTCQFRTVTMHLAQEKVSDW